MTDNARPEQAGNIRNIDTAELIRTLSLELASIAGAIERFPLANGYRYSHEEMEALQNIDLCSQKLHDIASAMRLIAHHTGGIGICANAVEQSVKLEVSKGLAATG